MSVFKSNKHIYVQVIDDSAGRTLAAISDLEKEFASLGNTIQDGEKIGEALGERLKKANIGTVLFDRNGFLYHGVVKAVAEGARKAGIVF
jgi:large subunit ribosomal protein L18